jgi:hypothetical protein
MSVVPATGFVHLGSNDFIQREFADDRAMSQVVAP